MGVQTPMGIPGLSKDHMTHPCSMCGKFVSETELAKFAGCCKECHGRPPNRFREHQAKAGRSRSPRKLAALAENRKKALEAIQKKYPHPSPGALYQRARRARLKKERTT